jgi:hypothetical protein
MGDVVWSSLRMGELALPRTGRTLVVAYVSRYVKTGNRLLNAMRVLLFELQKENKCCIGRNNL